MYFKKYKNEIINFNIILRLNSNLFFNFLVRIQFFFLNNNTLLSFDINFVQARFNVETILKSWEIRGKKQQINK